MVSVKAALREKEGREPTAEEEALITQELKANFGEGGGEGGGGDGGDGGDGGGGGDGAEGAAAAPPSKQRTLLAHGFRQLLREVGCAGSAAQMQRCAAEAWAMPGPRPELRPASEGGGLRGPCLLARRAHRFPVSGPDRGLLPVPAVSKAGALQLAAA
jgi:hypothetical protein